MCSALDNYRRGGKRALVYNLHLLERKGAKITEEDAMTVTMRETERERLEEEEEVE